uniref:Uncharacterized protein AlNc14C94G5790 n=1 Tax=Albugo laibachii Nc14 TaxID=890382 RepID=F0WGR3_9STRA|nr:conserved hypothetical protein [Albugo laibachii Nc14]|eukprot:CCA20427.1 conserved hypothetical protein [Albugo laibachii Nc14]
MAHQNVIVLRSMFPTWKVNALNDVLHANQGHLDRTIDAILSLSQPSDIKTARLVLPDDFLRLTELQETELKYTDTGIQEEQDAMLARMLQTEYFASQLLADDTVMFERSALGFQNDEIESSTTEAAFKAYLTARKRISSASEAAKSKMHELYLRFQTRNDARSRRDPYSHRPLVSADSESDDEYGGVGVLSRHETEMHLRPAQYTSDGPDTMTRGKSTESRFGQPPLPKYEEGRVNRSGKHKSM